MRSFETSLTYIYIYIYINTYTHTYIHIRSDTSMYMSISPRTCPLHSSYSDGTFGTKATCSHEESIIYIHILIYIHSFCLQRAADICCFSELESVLAFVN